MYQVVGRVDAVISVAGLAKFSSLATLSDEDFSFSLMNKLMGQVNLVRFGFDHVKDQGSFALTSGVLSRLPMIGSAAISLVNAGLEGFARAAALEAPRGIRINAVSPPWVKETLQVLGMARQKQTGLPLEEFLQSLTEHPPQRAPGTAVFMAGNRDALSRAFLQNYACNRVVHERVVLLTVMIRNIPWVRVAEQIKVEPLSQGFYRLTIGFGFMDRPDVSRALERCKEHGLPLDLSKTWFLLSRATIVPTREKGMALWREHLFAVMARNARTAGDYFNIPPGRVIEMGSKIEI